METQMILSREKSYVEILEILKYMDKIYVDKIPQNLIDFFKENKAKDYDFKYNIELGLEQQNLNNNTLALLAMLNINYWCEDDEHKKELIIKYNENEQKYQEKLREKYNPDDIFRNRNKMKDEEENVVNNEIVLVEYKESIFKKMVNKIKAIFHIK